MKLLLNVNDINPNEWESLVKSSKVATWFQTKEAFAFFDSLSYMEAFIVAVETEASLKGLVVACILKDGGKLKQFFSRRAIVLGGPLLAEDITDEELKMMLGALKENMRPKAIFIETRNFNDYSCWRKTFEDCGFEYEPHYDIHIDSSSMDVVHEKMGKSRKRDVRISIRDGASLIGHPTIEQVKSFYVVLSDLYKTKVKTPLAPWAFFEALYKLPASQFILVEYRGEIVGGTVTVGLSDKALYEMYVCGKDAVYKNIFPSELATYAGLQYAAENGFRIFDMMGAGKPDDGGYGVRDFKLKFGGDLFEFGRFVHLCSPFLYRIGKMGVKLMKAL